ncbi:MAG: division/cell wall cluster transcriptional repressor MraZ [Clostridia bacterium]|nr:division/cell wall cluster transcriptional repressor MraZ [Clostridia bacterium]
MFVGEFSHNIDSKGRIIMPVKFREQLGEHFMITKGLDGCLFVYPMDEWEKVAENLAKLPSNQKSARFLQRTFLSGASEAEPDKQGKVLITQPHREYAQLTKEVIIIGVSKRVEIWDAEVWKKYSMPEDDGEFMTAEEAAESMEAISF